MHGNKSYAPNSCEIRKMILNEMHNIPYAGHQGYQKTIAEIWNLLDKWCRHWEINDHIVLELMST